MLSTKFNAIQTFRKTTIDNSVLMAGVMDYVNSLPSNERKQLKEDLTYNKNLSEEFSSKLNSFFLLYFIKDKQNFEKKSKPIIEKMITDNNHILGMYRHHLNCPTNLYGYSVTLEIIMPKIKLILDKGLLKAQLSNQLTINDSKPIKQLKI